MKKLLLLPFLLYFTHLPQTFCILPPENNVKIDYQLGILNVTDTEDTYVPETLFQGSANFWRQIIFYKNKRLAIFSARIENMKNLEFFQCRGNRLLQKLPSKMFKKCENLKQIGFTYNGISELPHQFLAGRFPQLLVINLSFNRLRTLPRKFVSRKNAPNLRRLDLSNNFIKFVDCQTFSHLPNLRYLSLAHNRMTEIHSHLMGLGKLEKLKLSDNYVFQRQHMPKEFFDYIPSKTRIWWGKQCSISGGCDQVMSRNILRFWLDENFEMAKTEEELVIYHNHGIREIPSVGEIVSRNWESGFYRSGGKMERFGIILVGILLIFFA